MMPEPRKNVAGNMYGRKDAIRILRCIHTMGCGRDITTKEYQSWNIDTRSEYEMSGLCFNCQNLVFVEDECICTVLDAITINNPWCLEHGDPDYLEFTIRFDYDPDMREDDKPHDIYEIKWSGTYAQHQSP